MEKKTFKTSYLSTCCTVGGKEQRQTREREREREREKPVADKCSTPFAIALVSDLLCNLFFIAE
jgi:hypothetical protein